MTLIMYSYQYKKLNSCINNSQNIKQNEKKLFFKKKNKNKIVALLWG